MRFPKFYFIFAACVICLTYVLFFQYPGSSSSASTNNIHLHESPTFADSASYLTTNKNTISSDCVDSWLASTYWLSLADAGVLRNQLYGFNTERAKRIVLQKFDNAKINIAQAFNNAAFTSFESYSVTKYVSRTAMTQFLDDYFVKRVNSTVLNDNLNTYLNTYVQDAVQKFKFYLGGFTDETPAMVTSRFETKGYSLKDSDMATCKQVSNVCYAKLSSISKLLNLTFTPSFPNEGAQAFAIKGCFLNKVPKNERQDMLTTLKLQPLDPSLLLGSAAVRDIIINRFYDVVGSRNETSFPVYTEMLLPYSLSGLLSTLDVLSTTKNNESSIISELKMVMIPSTPSANDTDVEDVIRRNTVISTLYNTTGNVMSDAESIPWNPAKPLEVTSLSTTCPVVPTSLLVTSSRVGRLGSLLQVVEGGDDIPVEERKQEEGKEADETNKITFEDLFADDYVSEKGENEIEKKALEDWNNVLKIMNNLPPERALRRGGVTLNDFMQKNEKELKPLYLQFDTLPAETRDKIMKSGKKQLDSYVKLWFNTDTWTQVKTGFEFTETEKVELTKADTMKKLGFGEMYIATLERSDSRRTREKWWNMLRNIFTAGNFFKTNAELEARRDPSREKGLAMEAFNFLKPMDNTRLKNFNSYLDLVNISVDNLLTERGTTDVQERENIKKSLAPDILGLVASTMARKRFDQMPRIQVDVEGLQSIDKEELIVKNELDIIVSREFATKALSGDVPMTFDNPYALRLFNRIGTSIDASKALTQIKVGDIDIKPDEDIRKEILDTLNTKAKQDAADNRLANEIDPNKEERERQEQLERERKTQEEEQKKKEKEGKKK